MSKIIDIGEELEGLARVLEGTTQGAALRRVLEWLSEQAAVSERHRRLTENLRGWRNHAGHYCTCGNRGACIPCVLDKEYRELMHKP